MQVYVATADVESTLARLSDQAPSRPLVVTDITRGDLLLGLSAAGETAVGPHVAGILCTNSAFGQQPMGLRVQRILEVCPCLFSAPTGKPSDTEGQELRVTAGFH